MKHSRVQSTGTHHTGYDQGGAAEASFPVETAQRTKSKQQAASSKKPGENSHHRLAAWACLGLRDEGLLPKVPDHYYYVLCTLYYYYS